MIRVNLLPNAAERRAAPEGSQAWLLLLVGVVIIELVGLFLLHQTKMDALNQVTNEVSEKQSQVSAINDLLKNSAQVKKELATMRAREDAIAKLQAARKGPTSVLLELSRVLTRGKGPTVDQERYDALKQENPLAVFNPSWDTRRVWLTKYNEEERKVTIEGMARDASDVYEFAQRLRLSRFFDDVRLKEGVQDKAGGDKDVKIEMDKFAVEVKVKY